MQLIVEEVTHASGQRHSAQQCFSAGGARGIGDVGVGGRMPQDKRAGT